jgi:lipoprotein-releasing system ATP-binding protein
MSEAPHQPMVACRDLKKVYREGPAPVTVLQGVNLAVSAGARIAIVGRSGSGKSTLLHLLGGLDTPTEGAVMIQGRPFSEMSEAERGEVRNKTLGFVYQFHHLLPEFTAAENVAMPLFIRRMSRKDALARAAKVLQEVGLGARLEHQPGELSGGERQRVAIARALVREPRLLLCDEPTGNLDRASADQVASLILELHRQRQGILIIVTHSAQLAANLPIRFELVDRQLRRS